MKLLYFGFFLLLCAGWSSCDKNPYQVLGLKQNASPTEIKQAFKKLAVKFHPDKNQEGDSATKFIAIKDAYAILSSPTKKQDYDDLLAASKGGGLFSDVANLFKGQGTSQSTVDPIHKFTRSHLEKEVLGSNCPWIIQVAENSISGRFLAIQWNRIARDLQSEICFGRVVYSEDPELAFDLISYARNPFLGIILDSLYMPTLIGFPPQSKSFNDGLEYKGPISQNQLADFVAEKLLKLPQMAEIGISGISAEAERAFSQGKVFMLLAGGSVKQNLVAKITAKKYSQTISFCQIPTDSTQVRHDLSERFGLSTFPSLLIFQDPGMRPKIYTGSNSPLNISDIAFKLQNPSVPVIDYLGVQKIGCGWGLGTSHADLVQACAVLVSSDRAELYKARKKLAAVASSFIQGKSPAAKAFRSKSLQLGWLNAGNARDFIDFHLQHQRSSYLSERDTKRKSSEVYLIVYQPGAAKLSKYLNVPHRFMVFDSNITSAKSSEISRWISAFIEGKLPGEVSVQNWPPQLVPNTFLFRGLLQIQQIRKLFWSIWQVAIKKLDSMKFYLPVRIEGFSLIQVILFAAALVLTIVSIRRRKTSFLSLSLGFLGVVVAWLLYDSVSSSIWWKPSVLGIK